MNDSVPVVAAGRAWRWWDVLRVAMVVLWLLAAVGAWWTAPRQQSYAQARADLAGGRVTAYAWGDDWDTDASRRWLSSATLRSCGPAGPVFAWRTADGRLQWADTDDYDQVTISDAVDQANYSGAGAARIAQDVQAAGLAHRAGNVYPLEPGLAAAGAMLGTCARPGCSPCCCCCRTAAG